MSFPNITEPLGDFIIWRFRSKTITGLVEVDHPAASTMTIEGV
jgi:hypothetical protein